MREILFRGKRLDNGEQVYGDLVRIPHDMGSWSEPPSTELDWFITDSQYLTKEWIEVDPTTVGQYTGLVDGRGTRIFEADKCAFAVFDAFGADTQYTGIVMFDGGEWQLWASEDSPYYGSDGPFSLYAVRVQDDEFEVTGSIHDGQEAKP
jgi:hypothetical protein